MKRLLLHMALIWSVLPNAFSQGSCNSLRYQQQVFQNVSTTTGIYFATATPYGVIPIPQDLYLDIYEPAGDTVTRRPVVFYQFGGGFLIGTRNEPDIPSYATYLAQCGYVVVSIDYRLGFNPLDGSSIDRAFYRAVQDHRAALRYLFQRAAQYRIDTNNIFTTGSSAGCMTALSSAFMSQSQWPSDIHGSLLEPDDLGGLNMSGNNDYNNQNPHIRGIINHWGSIHDTNYITPVDSNIPILSIQGTLDVIVPYYDGYPFSFPVAPYEYGSYDINIRMDNLHFRNKLVPLVGYLHEPELLSPNILDTMEIEGRDFMWGIIKPVTSPITGPAQVCEGSTVTYSVINTPGSRYCWQLTGNGSIIQDNNNSIEVVWGDTGNVSVTVTELNYMAAQADPVTYQSHVVPHAHAFFIDTVNQLQVTFINQSSNATRYAWTFGNGDTSSLLNPAEHYAVPDTYTVTLVSSNQACSDTMRNTVVTYLCPSAHFTDSVHLLDAYFANTSLNSTGYLWTFGNGDTSANANPVKIYDTINTYTVTLVAYNHYCSDTFSNTVTTYLCPLAAFTDSVNQVNAWFHNTSQYATNYFWDFGNGDTSLSANPVEHFSSAAPFIVTLIAGNQFCADTSRNLLTTYFCPSANFTDSIRQLNVYFTNGSLNADGYFWDFGNGDTSTSQSPIEYYTADGAYVVKLISYNLYCADTLYDTITVHSCPVANYSYRTSELQVAFWNNSTGAASYYWEFGNGDTSTAINPTENYTAGGTYTVVLIANTLYCRDTFRNTFTIDSCPRAAFTYQNANLLCSFTADSTNTTSYSWNFGDGDTSMVPARSTLHQYLANGDYTVLLKVMNSLGCQAHDSALVKVEVTGINIAPSGGISVNCNLSGECKVAIGSPGEYLLEVFDVAGRSLLKRTFYDNYLLETPDLSQGIYFLRVSNGTEVVVKKFMR